MWKQRSSWKINSVSLFGLGLSIFIKKFEIYLVTESLEEIKQSILNTEEVDWNTIKNWIERDKYASEFPH